MDKSELEQVLKESLAIEQKGHKWYSECAEKIKNSLGRRMLKRLAEDELIHIQRIKEIYESVTKNTLDEVKVESPHLAMFSEIFNRMKDQLDEAVDEMTELESYSRFFYEDAAQKASDKVVKDFYKLLAKEEKSHYELLQKTNQYLANPSLFFGMSDH